MKLRTIQSIENDDYVFLFVLENIGTDDIERIAKFGEPVIDIGGAFSQGEVSFTIPSVYKKIYSDFPIRKIITTAAPFDTDLDNKLTLYRTTIVSRIETAMDTLRATADTFTGEFVTVV